MTINPCCIPLKTGVRMVTHLSMALALAVGWTALKLISISSEVSTNVTESEETTSSAGTIMPNRNMNLAPPSLPPLMTPYPPYYQHQPHYPFYNGHTFGNQQQHLSPYHHQYPVLHEGREELPPHQQYRIPYEYILYHKWHQQQQQQQQNFRDRSGGGGHQHSFDSHQSSFYNDNNNNNEKPYDDWYNNNNNYNPNNNMHWFPPPDQGVGGTPEMKDPDGDDREGGDDVISVTGLNPALVDSTNVSEKDEEKDDSESDKQHKIFRTILHHRKNFKGRPPVTLEEDVKKTVGESLPSPTEDSLRNSETEHKDLARVAELVSSSFPAAVTPLSLEPERPKSKREGHVPKDGVDWSPFPFRKESSEEGEEGKETSSSRSSSSSSSAAAADSPDYHYFSPSAQAATRQQDQESLDSHEMNRRLMMMMMSGTVARENSQSGSTSAAADNNEGGYFYGRKIGGGSTRAKKRPADATEHYAKVLLVCGLLALCTVVFQFLTSFLLLCFVDKGSNASAQVWIAVNCSVIFCLATCLVLFLCEGLSMAKYAFDETLYLILVTIDSLLSIYFLWIVMAFI